MSTSGRTVTVMASSLLLCPVLVTVLCFSYDYDYSSVKETKTDKKSVLRKVYVAF